MLTTVRHIFGRIMHSETALHSQWDKGRKNNLLFASPSIRRPTACHPRKESQADAFYCCFSSQYMYAVQVSGGRSGLSMR